MAEHLTAYSRSRPSLRVKPTSHDWLLLLACTVLLSIGLLMVASSSIMVSQKFYGEAFHYLYHQLLYLGLGLLAAAAVLRIDTAIWQQFSRPLMLATLLMLALVFVPGLGHSANGSTRWLGVSPFYLQVSELAKFTVIIYLAAFAERYADQLQNEWQGVLKPLLVLSLISLLLLQEPDFGATVVILFTAFGLLFLAGVRLRQFLILSSLAAVAVSLIAIAAPYRVARLTSFLHPWENQFDSGYQLTQALIAFGRGGCWGEGLGESVQKLFYLPEAHTDFLFAVLAEEFGLAGILVVIACFILLIFRTFLIGYRAQHLQRHFAAYCAYGIGFWLGIQAIVNMGVNSGMLPTKGLTLPLMSYGGNSLLMVCIAIALLFRIDYENRSYFQETSAL